MSEDREALRELLLRHSIKVGDFVLASGARSKHYVDVRKTALTGSGASLIGALLLQIARQEAPHATGVGGLTLGADPIITALTIAADRAGLDWGGVIVRKESKGHGTGNWLESAGNLAPDAELVVVDDVVTTAGSTVLAIERLRESGFVIQHALAVVDRQAGARERLAEVGVTLHALFELPELVGETPG